MTASDPVVVVGMARTPMGGLLGELAPLSGHELGAITIEAALGRAGVEAADVSETLMGCVLSAGQGQAPARQAAKAAGIPDDAGAVTVNKMCGSGMKTVMIGHDSLLAGTNAVVVAGGMESMTNAPYLLPKARGGYRLGHGEVKDHMFLDGLEDAYEPGRLMGTFAEDTAKHYQFTREAQDAYAIESLNRAQKANEDGTFAQEIVSVGYSTKKGEVTVETDEQPRKARPDKIPELKPAFAKDGTVTAANASSISDGAAALVLMRRSEAERRGLEILAEIKGHAGHAQAPAWFTTAPVAAIEKVLERVGWSKGDVDLWEVNEAFAVVPMAAMKEHGIPHDVMNLHGGACALGHPIGASGARILVTLINALRQNGGKRGVAAICIGGGEATSVALELAG